MVTIVIPVYKPMPSDVETISFRQAAAVLRNYRFSIVTYHELDISYYSRVLQESGIEYSTVIFDKKCFSGIASYNRLLLSKEFYEAFEHYTYILIYQLDAYVFKDELKDWCARGYDYIGAPWFKDFASNYVKPGLVAVGNGGLSLRKISSFLAAFGFIEKNDKRISPFNYWNKHLIKRYYGYSPRFILSRFFGKSNTLKYFYASTINEDAFWSQILPEAVKTFMVAPVDEAMKFAFESDPTYLFQLNGKKLPFGTHAWHKNQYKEFWSEYIKLDNRI